MRIALALLVAVSALAQETHQPFIDRIKRKLPPKAAESGSYTESLKQGLPAKPQTEGPIERYRRKHPDAAAPAPSFVEEEKRKLGPPRGGGAIQALQEGRSELKARREGEPTSSFGFRYGIGMSRAISAIPERLGRSYDEIYGDSYTPDFGFFYEWQMLRSETFGSIGLMADLGASFVKGFGIFAVTLTNPKTGQPFPTQSKTSLLFVSVPATVAGTIRFSLARYIRPFALVGPTAIGYAEIRGDSKDGSNGLSTGVYLSGGANILLDFLSSNDLYDDFRIHHTYLTLAYSRLSTLSGDVDFAVSGVNAGFTFEF
jgi:hypothetical protein